jgi:hypothetical protein
MEYIDGEDLRVLLRRIGRLPADNDVEIARQFCAGLAAAHDKAVLHRDLEPANIMIDGRGQVRITDFGLARLTGDDGSREIVGTSAYMAPEQLLRGETSVHSDIYSLGLILSEVFTGKQVHDSNSPDVLRKHHEESTATRPSQWGSDLDPAVDRVILRCLDSDPMKRPSSAHAVAAGLPEGDPLAAALAAGETPSPQLVAAAGDQTGLQPSVEIGLLIAVCLLAVAAIPLIPLTSSWVAPTVYRFSAPVVAVISVEDKAIVDQFLEDADPLIGQLAQQRPSGFLPVDYQYSRLQIDGHQIRSFSFNAFGVGLRGYLVRLGDNLYITSQLELIRDLIAMKSKEGGTPKSIRPSQAGQVHGWMWPINYDESRESYQFEWAAANQKACIKNLPSISGVLRAGIATSMDQVVGQAALRDGATYACPSGGRYSVEQGQFGPHAVCDLHGHLLDPKQPIAPARQSETGKLLAELKSVSVAANLSPEGLRAVISVQRSKKTP